MQIDRPLVARLAQQRDHPLAFAEPIDADHMGALGELRVRPEQLRHFLARVAMLEHRQREGRLGDEEIARDELEGGAGRVGAPLVIAGDDDARALPLDQHLRAAEHVPGREQRHRHVADGDPFAIGGRLRALLAGVPSRVVMTASVSRVASTCSCPGRAWSEWPCVMTARLAPP